ncbi:MAG: hypothetical protein A2107_10175 [Verrucomicrobia bacterium GWF2_62_7]|nr:MAG: hypothetical protein A2107_10175 [Verrucomicrobia bacterium GWF2_62_7]
MQPLLKATSDKRKNLLLLHAIEALGRLRALLPSSLLDSDDWAARGFAAATLTDAGKLRVMRKTDKNPFVLSRIEEALEKLDKESHEDRLRR